jgi:DNA-binding MarR family transcriptional regulator
MSGPQDPVRNPPAEAFTRLILETFRFNGQLLGAGDRVTKEFGLSSSLWQVLGAIDEASASVAQIARNMGLTRQSVRRTARVLMKRGFVTFEENPNHRRAKLVVLTESGREVLDRVSQAQIAWANRIAQGLSAREIDSAVHIMRTLCERL